MRDTKEEVRRVKKVWGGRGEDGVDGKGIAVFSSSLTVALDGSIDNSAIFIDVPSGNEEGKDEVCRLYMLYFPYLF